MQEISELVIEGIQSYMKQQQKNIYDLQEKAKSKRREYESNSDDDNNDKNNNNRIEAGRSNEEEDNKVQYADSKSSFVINFLTHFLIRHVNHSTRQYGGVGSVTRWHAQRYSWLELKRRKPVQRIKTYSLKGSKSNL